jgi:hypothetical protein
MSLHPQDRAVLMCPRLSGMRIGLCVLIQLLWLLPMPFQAEETADPAYLKVVTERAAKIVDTLDIQEGPKRDRVTDLIAQQYVNLSRIHDARDQNVAQARAASDADAAAAIEAAKNAADARIYRVHVAFLAGLSVELTPVQVDGVKDGMTYGVATNTYGVYLKMCPDLSEAQKRRIKSWLLEARELAMDQGSSKEKHGVFGKYKGKINNYLAAAGYDLKEAEKNLYR